MTDRVERIVIVGGGVAGAMAAAALARVFGKRTLIHVISPGTAERVLPLTMSWPPLAAFHGLLGLDEAHLIASIGASFSLGCRYRDWLAPGSAYFQSWGESGVRLANTPFHHHWIRARQAGREVGAFEDYDVAAVAARDGRFARPRGNDAAPGLPPFGYGMHFAIAPYVRYLRNFAEAQGVRFTPARVVGVAQEKGFIRSLALDSGETVAGDLFLDCSGDAAVLMAALGSGYTRFDDVLFCDRVLTRTEPLRDAPLPYAEAIAREAGWELRLQAPGVALRASVYSSRHAAEEAGSRAFGPGRRERFWSGNCIALGAAASVLDPLESTGLHLIHSGISKLMGMFPGKSCSGAESDEYNRLLTDEHARILDKLVLHYVGAGREDTSFWRDARSVPVSEQLERKMKVFAARGGLVLYDEESFLGSQWIAAFLGNGIVPARYDLFADEIALDETARLMAAQRKAVADMVFAMPTHAAYLRQFNMKR